MAEEAGGAKSEIGIGAIVAFFGAIFALWLFTNGGQNGGLFGNASSTNLLGINASSSESISGRDDFEEGTSTDFYSESTPETDYTTPKEIESELRNTQEELVRVKEDVRLAKLWGVHSPHEGKVRLGSGSTWGTDPATEYLTLSADGTTEPVSISGWILESTVSGKRVTIPLGTRLVRHNGTNTGAPITLEANEMAYLLTGESPVGISFHENKCAGYLAEFQNFTPSLYSSCPYPLPEMKEFGKIALDDDACYQAVSRTSSCRIVSKDILAATNLTPACRTFLQNDLTYSGCVRNHEYEPYFYDGSWRIYFSHHGDLWRGEREIIRLEDTEGKTVSVLEY